MLISADAATLADVEAALRAEAAGLGEGDWLLGWGLDPNVFGEDPVSNAVLDAVAGSPRVHPILRRSCRLASSRARARGCHGRRVFTDGSWVVTDEAGLPTGYLLELQPVHLVERCCPADFDQRTEALYERAPALAHADSPGQVQDLAPDAIELLEAIEATRDLLIRR